MDEQQLMMMKAWLGYREAMGEGGSGAVCFYAGWRAARAAAPAPPSGADVPSVREWRVAWENKGLQCRWHGLDSLEDARASLAFVAAGARIEYRDVGPWTTLPTEGTYEGEESDG